jgi:nitrogen fixation/metabolism regulation signal transduction histidine kinase
MVMHRMRLSKAMYVMVLSLILLLTLAYIDLITGYDLSFFVFYFIPISIVAWYAGRSCAILISLFAAFVWLLVDQLSGHPYSNWSFPYWNAFVRWISFVMLAITISQIKFMLEKEQKIKQELSHVLDKIRLYVDVAKSVAEGNLAVSWPVFEQVDADPLDATFRFMLKRLTDQKNLEKRLAQLERQAIMAETASHLAHEIRNPLNLIMLTAHHVGNQFIPQEEAKRRRFEELITSLKSEVEHLNKVVSDFIAMGKPSELHKINVALSDVISQILILIKQQLLEKHISFEFSGETDMTIYVDPEQLRLVFLNLFVNAIAAVAEHGKIWFQAGFDPDKKQVILTVADNGPGIKPEDIERIFEPYFTRKLHGTGLGLALVKRIVEEHNGRIRVQNRIDGGACFKIILPLEG